MPYNTVNQLKLHYYKNQLKDIPILFLHGWLGNSLEWIHQFCYFYSKKHVIVLDLPGFGKSDKPKVNYSIEFFTKQILDFMNSIGYSEFILIGHSLGGMIAQNLAFQNPDLVKKVILISTTSKIPQSIKQKFFIYWMNLMFRIFYKKILKIMINQIISVNNRNIEFLKLYKYAKTIPKQVVLNSFKNMTSKTNLSDILCKINQPTLIIYGNVDKIINESMITDLVELIPNSKDVKIQNGQHRIMFDNHQKINKIIEEFIEK